MKNKEATTGSKIVGRRSAISGRGLFAAAPISKGEVILIMSGRKATHAEIERLHKKRKIRWDDPFEYDWNKYIILDPIPVLGNHSCNPNAGINANHALVALRKIKKGEEITFDYSAVVGRNMPGESDWKMRCRCSAKNCRKIIGNWETLPRRQLKKYADNNVILPYILKQVRGEEEKR